MHKIREYRDGDATPLGELFYESIQVGAREAYDQEQRDAWASKPPSGEPWRERLASSKTWIAEDEIGPTGFMSLKPSGHLDLAFVRSDRIGQGVAKALFDVVLDYARSTGIERLTTDASRMSKPFFARQGWTLLDDHQACLGSVSLQCSRMELRLRPEES